MTEIEWRGLNHVCVVVRDMNVAEEFYGKTLGLRRHQDVASWWHLGGGATLHIIDVEEEPPVTSEYFRIQHFAAIVNDLEAVTTKLLSAGRKPFQMDMEGNTQGIAEPIGALDFGIGTVFVEDPDGNLIEFIQYGRGIY